MNERAIQFCDCWKSFFDWIHQWEHVCELIVVYQNKEIKLNEEKQWKMELKFSLFLKFPFCSFFWCSKQHLFKSWFEVFQIEKAIKSLKVTNIVQNHTTIILICNMYRITKSMAYLFTKSILYDLSPIYISQQWTKLLSINKSQLQSNKSTQYTFQSMKRHGWNQKVDRRENRARSEQHSIISHRNAI